jgi:hypothetical protein
MGVLNLDPYTVVHLVSNPLVRGQLFWEDRFTCNFLVSYENYPSWKDTHLLRTEDSKLVTIYSIYLFWEDSYDEIILCCIHYLSILQDFY